MAEVIEPQSGLTEEEYDIHRHILAAYNGILDLNLTANPDELVSAVHVLQHFLMLRVLHREHPEFWGNWYG